MASVTITSTNGSSTTQAATLQVHIPATFAITGLTASTNYEVVIVDPDGTHANVGPNPYISDSSGNLTVANYVPAAVGQGSITVFTAAAASTQGPTTATIVNQL